MSLMWIKKQAPWVIGIFGVFILGGLLMMDRAGSYRSDRHHNIVGKVDGEEIPTDRFQQEMKNYLASEEARLGKAPEGLQLVQMREGLFNFKVQSVLIQKVFQEYQLFASVEEMQDYLLKHPQEVGYHIQRYRGIEQVPPFLADSAVDQGRYEAWLNQDSIYDRVSMRDLEQQLKTSVIPQIQLQQIMKSQIHPTHLEGGFTVALRENRARLTYYHVPTDSFPVAPDKFKDPELKAYFEAHPDSFHFREDAARLGYVQIPLQPSAADTNLMLEFAKGLKERALGGEKFADLAKDYSNDPATAEKGGKLEGWQTRQRLEPNLAEAVFVLNPGEISQPVLTSAGYFLVLLDEKKGADSVSISQILLHVSTGTETVDSLMEVAEKVRAQAQKEGLEKTARSHSLRYEQTPIFEKTNMTPLGSAYIQGANSFAFSEFEAKEKISEALQAENGIYLFERTAKFGKGRDFDRAKSRIAELLVMQEKSDLAKKELEGRKSAIVQAGESALPAQLGKAVLDSTRSGPISADNWLPGFGYSSPALFATFAQNPGVWGEIRTTDQGAVIAKVTEKLFLTDQEARAKYLAQPPQPEPYQASTIYQEWVGNLPKTVKVENKLDMVYKN